MSICEATQGGQLMMCVRRRERLKKYARAPQYLSLEPNYLDLNAVPLRSMRNSAVYSNPPAEPSPKSQVSFNCNSGVRYFSQINLAA
ncbi:hypothetical protein ACTXT7_004962 [Hymenolepis weldensis]